MARARQTGSGKAPSAPQSPPPAAATAVAAAAAVAGGAHVALLRGINVGGKNKLPMKDLAELFRQVGCTEVVTLIQSGNVVCRASAALTKSLPGLVEAAIVARFGFAVPVVMRSAAELRAVVQENPYLATGADTGTLHVAFLADLPSEAALAALDPARSPPDTFAARGRHLYLCCPNGLGRSRLTNDYFDRTLKTTSTVRNWATVQKLAAMANGEGAQAMSAPRSASSSRRMER